LTQRICRPVGLRGSEVLTDQVVIGLEREEGTGDDPSGIERGLEIRIDGIERCLHDGEFRRYVGEHAVKGILHVPRAASNLADKIVFGIGRIRRDIGLGARGLALDKTDPLLLRV
jgi:hypothetical protein